METDQFPHEPLPDTLPGYVVNFHVYRSGVTAVISEVAHRAGRRRVIATYRIGAPVDLPLGTGARADVAALCGLLRDWLLYDA